MPACRIKATGRRFQVDPCIRQIEGIVKCNAIPRVFVLVPIEKQIPPSIRRYLPHHALERVGGR